MRAERQERGGRSPVGGSPSRLVEPTLDPGWLLVEGGFELAREHEVESLFACGNGTCGVRAALPERTSFSEPATWVAGVYGRPPGVDVPVLASLPDWTRVAVRVGDLDLAIERGTPIEHRRILDMRQGVFFLEWRHRDPAGRVTRVRGVRLASLADRHLLYQSLSLTPENYSGRVRADARVAGAPLAPVGWAPSIGVHEAGVVGSRAVVALAVADRLEREAGAPEGPGGWIPAGGVVEGDVGIESTRRLDRLVSVSSSREGPSPGARASRRLERSVREGIPSVVAAHAAAWAARWEDADVEVLGDDGATRALRFAAYHLVSAANPQDERVSIPARALTGPAYLGHVFWDTEVFMLPFFVFTHPPSARALLMYRWHTLDAARARARAMGYRGALYAWESADTGEEVTPPSVVDPEGRRVRIRNGELEQHVSAAVAFGAWQYAQVADDEEFLAGPGAEILLETARFWASRAVRGEDGLYHVLEAIGPDEYHEAVDDNAYTNGMARWNLRKGLEVLDWLRGRSPDRLGVLEERLGLGGEEPAAWGEIAGAMYDGLDPASGVIEQFRGYFGLEPIDLAAHEPRSAPMDVLLGAERTRRSQVIKQADVVQLVHLLWDELPPRVREASFRYYEPRCGHGSSLSPPVHAVVAARIGDAELAARYFRQTAEIDLADNMGNAAGGVHAAALGGLWQAAVMGFGGLRATASGLAISPRLPPGWRRLRFVARWRGARTVFCIGPGEVRVDVSGARGLRVGLDGGPSVAARPGRGYRAAAVDGGFGAWREVRG